MLLKLLQTLTSLYCVQRYQDLDFQFTEKRPLYSMCVKSIINEEKSVNMVVLFKSLVEYNQWPDNVELFKMK